MDIQSNHKCGFTANITFRRQEPSAKMAIHASTTATPPDPMGNSISCLDAGQNANSSARQLLCHHGQPRHAHLLHDWSTYTLLVRISFVWKRVRTICA